MVDPLYKRLQRTAQQLIAKFGQVGTIRRTTTSGPTYDPETTVEDHPCKLVVLEYADANVDGTLIRGTDKQVYVSTDGLPVAIAQSDKIVVGGSEYSIERLKPLSPSDVVVYWEIQARS